MVILVYYHLLYLSNNKKINIIILYYVESISSWQFQNRRCRNKWPKVEINQNGMIMFYY